MIVTNALVLRRSDYRDYDRMLTLLSPTHGRIEASARGVKRPKSPLLNAAELFSAGEYVLAPTKAGFTLAQCQIHESYYPLRQTYEKLIHAAYYAHLLLLAALPEEPCESLFSLALQALAHVSYSDLPDALVTAAFEMHYMALLGQSPRMGECVQCGRGIPSGEGVRFDVELGGVVCGACSGGGQKISDGARRILMKAPRVEFSKTSLLREHPQWPEAAAHIRRFLIRRIEPYPRQIPDLPP